MARTKARPQAHAQTRSRVGPLDRQVGVARGAPAGAAVSPWERLDPRAVVEAAWLAVAVAVPAVFVPPPHLKDAFELPKLVVFRSVFLGALAIAAALAVWRGDRPPRRLMPLRIWVESGWLAGAAAALLALSFVLATIFSVAPIVSFWGGHPPSIGGLWTLLAMVGLFVSVAAGLRTERQLRRLAVAIAAGATVSALYAAIQAAGRDPFHWTTVSGNVASWLRVAGTLGNPNFIGGYLAIACFVTLGVALAARGRVLSALALAGLALQLLAIYKSGTRGAWIGVAAGTVVLAVLLTAQRRGPWRRVLAGFAVAGIAGVAALWFLQPYLPAGSSLAQIASLFRPTEGSAGVRLVLWRMAVTLWLRRPVLGYGPDSLESVMERAFGPTTETFLQGTGATRVENAVLDTLVSAGVVGLVALAAVTTVSFVYGIRAFLQTRSPLIPALLAGAVAHIVSQMVLITEMGAGTTACLVFGALVAAGRSVQAAHAPHGLPKLKVQSADGRGRAGGRPMVPVAVPLAVGLIVAMAMAWWNVRQFRAGLAYTDSVNFGAAGRSGEAIVALEQAVSLWPFDYRALAELTSERRGAAASQPRAAQTAALRKALRTADRALALSPDHPYALSEWAATAGELAAVTGDNALADRARAAYAHATTLAPNSSFAWKSLGATELRLGRPAAARDALGSATTLLPRDWQAWVLLGQASAATGDQAGARAAYRQALNVVPANSPIRKELETLAGG